MTGAVTTGLTRNVTRAALRADGLPPAPLVSSDVHYAVRRAITDGSGWPLSLKPADAEDARALLAWHEQALQPGDHAAWAAFLAPLYSVTATPPDDMPGWVAKAVPMLRPIPRALLTPERALEAGRRFKFWPAVAELCEWLEPLGAELRRTERGLRTVLAGAPGPAGLPPGEERGDGEEAKAKAAAYLAEVNARVAEERQRTARKRPVALPLSPAALREAHALVVAKGGRQAGVSALRLERMGGAPPVPDESRPG